MSNFGLLSHFFRVLSMIHPKRNDQWIILMVIQRPILYPLIFALTFPCRIIVQLALTFGLDIWP